jgi:hypothetical protein
LISVGLHPSVTSVYVPVNAGGVISLVQFTVLVMVAVLPQASRAVNVLTCDLKHPFELTAPSREVIVGVPHASVAVAEPREVLISAGLHPSVTSVYVPANTGGVTSLVQFTVLVIVAELPQASTAVNVLTWERRQPLLVTAPSLCVTVGVPHASVAVAEPREVLISAGLHPSVTSL